MHYILLLISIGCLLFWVSQLWTVVNMSDQDFNGRYDKLMWAMIILFGSILGAIMFALWRMMQRRSIIVVEQKESHFGTRSG